MINLDLTNDETNCIYSILASLCNYYRIDYDYMFIGMLGFNYERSAYKSIGMGITSGVNNPVCKEILEKEAKIKMIHIGKKSENNLFNIINENLAKSMPVIITSDLFWCPWSYAYQKYHFPHYYVIVDMVGYFKKIICIDPYLKKKEILLDKSTFLQGYNGGILHERDEDSVIKERNFVLKKLKEVIENNFNNDIFSQIKKLGDDIVFVDFSKEMEKGQELYSVALFDNIYELILCRKSFKKSLMKLELEYEKFHDALEYLDKSLSLLEKTRLFLMKYSLAQNYAEGIKKCANWIYGIANYELEMSHTIAKRLKQIC